ncbi:MAG: hypothetical protein QGE94_04490, partial [Desulfobacterales bacterium]|nr:hypothetical protein [Desulfobacterales bacterium]
MHILFLDDLGKCGGAFATVNSSSTDSDPAHGLSESQPTFKCNGHVAFGIPGSEDQLLCREAYAVG